MPSRAQGSPRRDPPPPREDRLILSRTHRRLALGAIAALGLALRLRALPDAPDTYDGVGFVEAVTDLDLARLRPHPPGYPLFVAFARVAHAFGLTPLHAVLAVSLVAGVALPIAAYAIVARAFPAGILAPFAAAFAFASAPGFVAAGATTMSDGAALACALGAYACALGDRPTRALSTGLLVAASIGVRIASTPIALPALFVAAHAGRRGAIEATLVSVLGSIAWVAPFGCVVGFRRWYALSQTQLEGHLARWGESAATWRGPGKAASIFDAIALQTFGVSGPNGVFLVVAALVVAVALLRLARRWRSSLVIAAAAPYVLFVAFVQPVFAAPRHALPVTAAALVFLASVLAEIEARIRLIPRAFGVVALLAVVAVRGFVAARTHAMPCPAVAMLRAVSSDPGNRDAAVVGGRTARFVAYGGGVRTAPGQEAGDAIIYATRASPLPNPLFVTSELDLRGIPGDRLRFVAIYRRDDPLDRRESTIALYTLGVLPR